MSFGGLMLFSAILFLDWKLKICNLRYQYDTKLENMNEPAIDDTGNMTEASNLNQTPYEAMSIMTTMCQRSDFELQSIVVIFSFDICLFFFIKKLRDVLVFASFYF